MTAGITFAVCAGLYLTFSAIEKRCVRQTPFTPDIGNGKVFASWKLAFVNA